MNFVAIDFETANPDLASICQIGVVTFQDGIVSHTWDSLLDPQDYFDPINISIHGITEEMVEGSPTFPDVFDVLQLLIAGQVVVCHTHFDRVALNRAIEEYDLPLINCVWLDTAKVVRRTWSQFAWRDYGLENVTEALGIKFEHHVAKEDARAAGEILLRAIAHTGLSLEDWLIRVKKPIDLLQAGRITREGNLEGPLSGEVVVFTGSLSIPRRKAADLASEAGCEVAASVKKTTTLLVVGDQDIRKLAGHEKSAKHRKAESLISKGQPIKIVGESDFLRILESTP